MSTLPSDTPRLPKWPFLVADAALLGIAVTIALRSPSPYSGSVILAIAGCVAFAAILGVLPFLADYAGKQDEALDERQRSLEALTRTVANSAEQISIAANGFHELSELAREQLKQAEALPEKFQSGLQDANREREEALVAENKALQKELKTLRATETGKNTDLGEQFHKAIEELKKLPVAPLAPTPVKKDRATTAKPKPVKEPTLAVEDSSEAKPSEPPPSPPSKEIKEPDPAKKDSKANPGTSEDPSPVESHSKQDEPEVAPQDSSLKASSETPSPTQKEKPAAKTEPPASEVIDQEPLTPSSPKETDESSSSDEFDLEEIAAPKAKHKISPDGVTRLIVTAYIGIGNRLFIRGNGPGLSGDKGIPLQFVSIGKWQWETADASAPVTFKLYKNDEVECLSLGEVTIDARSQAEVSASF